MPRLAASRCCCARRSGAAAPGCALRSCCSPTTVAIGQREPPAVCGCIQLFVVVGFPGHDGLFVEIERRRRRGGLPLQAGGVPGIVRSRLAVAHRPQEINHGQQISHAEHGCAGGREHVQHLKFGHVAVIVVAARHAHVAEQELREEREIEADEDDQRGQARPAFGIQPAGNFRPPEMHAAEIAHDRASHHDVVEVGDHEISVGDVDVDAERGQE